MKESLYRRIARELAQQILSGQYPVGSLLPTEMALCEHYQVSRHTMREALRDLTEQGLITRRKGSGTQVADKAQHKGLNQPLAYLEDLFFLAKNNPRVVKRIDEVVADYDLAQTSAVSRDLAGYTLPAFGKTAKTKTPPYAGRTAMPAPPSPKCANWCAAIPLR